MPPRAKGQWEEQSELKGIIKSLRNCMLQGLVDKAYDSLWKFQLVQALNFDEYDSSGSLPKPFVTNPV